MIYIPYYNALALPDVSCYFQLDYLNGQSDQPVSAGDKVLFLMLKNEKQEGEIEAEDIFPIAVRGVVESIDNQWALVHTTNRVNLDSIQVTGKSFRLEMRMRPDIDDLDPDEKKERFQKMRAAMLQTFQGSQWMEGTRSQMLRWKNMNEIVTFTSPMLRISNEEKYEILKEDSTAKRTELMEKAFYESLELYKVNSEAQSAQQETNEKLYREQAIRRQIDYLQKELDELHPENITEIRKFEQKIQESGMNETARAEAEKVLNRMKQEGQDSHEYGMLYDYLDFVTGLSWKKEKAEEIDLDEARRVLDEDHFGLKKTKERIIQQIAVMALNKKQSGSILLFVGAPGTGKTSIGQSIAKALKRKYVRISLGGVRDEAEIRGHRRTYIGAMPHHGRHQAQRSLQPGGGAGRGGQTGAGLRRRSLQRPAGGAGPGTELHIYRPLYERALRPVRRALCLHGQPLRHHSGTALKPDGGDFLPGLFRSGKIPDRQTPSSPQSHGESGNRGE